MTARILKGAEVADHLNAQIKADVESLTEQGITPTLCIVRVGNRGDDISYARGATKRAEKVGVIVKEIILPADCREEVLIETLERLNEDDAVHGVLLFRPLPAHIDEDRVRNTLLPSKDIDGITDLSLAGVFAGVQTGYPPCTPTACMEILDYYDISLKGAHAVVVGRSLVVGKPVAMMLLAQHATVTVAHSRTTELAEIVRQASVVIACAGQAQMIDASYLSSGQTVIDVGINVTDEGALVGDVNTDEALALVRAITPVPGGVGTVTTSVLMKHVVQAAKRTQK